MNKRGVRGLRRLRAGLAIGRDRFAAVLREHVGSAIPPRGELPEVQRLFALARLEDRLPFFDELDAALAA